MADAETLKVGLELALLLVSGSGTVVAALVKRSVGEQDLKLDKLGVKMDDLATKVGSHAEALARGEAQIKALQDKSAELEKLVREVREQGCARRCALDPRAELGRVG